MEIKRTFAVIPLAKANGHGVVRNVELFHSEELAEACIRSRLSDNTSRTGYVIYQAEALVRRVTAPIEVCGICDNGEVIS